MAKFNVPECPVCGENEFIPFTSCPDYFVSGEQFEIAECGGCGFKFTANAEEEQHAGKYYQSEEYISHSNTASGLVNSIYHKARRYMLGRKRRLIVRATSQTSGRILDVGAGTGFFLQEMKSHGWQVTGTEQDAGARAFALQEFGLKVLPSAELFDLEAGSFDAITLWHVLEHLHRLKENMESFIRLLRPGGRLVIAVPNHTSYDALHYKTFWAAWDVPRHLWHFGPNQMVRFGERYGFRLVSMHAMPFDAFYVSLLSEKYKKSKAAFIRGIW
jgi:SAM-dependent methyltransferase